MSNHVREAEPNDRIQLAKLRHALWPEGSVAESHRRQACGPDLLRRAEEWSRSQGCREMASDTWLDNAISQRAHESLGFEVVDRVVHYKKRL